MPKLTKAIHETTPTLHNPYASSSLIRKAYESLQRHDTVRLAFLDIDNTLTGGDIEDTNRVRQKLRSLGYAVCFVTARTEEALMSERAYKKSLPFGFSRPRPKLAKSDGKRKYIDPRLHEPEGLIDPDVIAGSTGTKILLRQESIKEVHGGFLEDFEYTEKIGVSSEHFRESVLGLLAFINHDHTLCRVAECEKEENYHNGLTDVFPADFRVSIEFESLEAKRQFLKVLSVLKKESPMFSKFIDSELIHSLTFTSDGFPKQGKLRGYITPCRTDKEGACEQVIDAVCSQLSIARENIETLFAGDAFPDLSMGLHAGAGTQAKFVLVGGSRLASYLTQKEIMDFAGETLAHIREKLFPTEQRGFYSYQHEGSISREVIIADLAFNNTFGPQSILQVFKE